MNFKINNISTLKALNQGWIPAQVCAELICLASNGKPHRKKVMDTCFYGSATAIAALIFDCSWIGLQGDGKTFDSEAAIISSFQTKDQLKM